MSIQSKSLAYSILVLLLGAAMAIAAYNDYSWDDVVRSSKQKEGWLLVSETANLIDPLAPWTFFRQPAVQLGFIKPNAIIDVSQGYRLTDVLWVRADDSWSRTNEEIFPNAFDCIRGMSASVSFKEGEPDLTNLKWRKTEAGLPGDDVLHYLCSL